jgi:predicted lipoprotein with Yx(FWY)xxD motif
MLGIPIRGLVVGVIVVASGLVAGCGGGSSKAPATTSTSTGSSHSSSDPGTKFSTASVSGLGTGLVEAKGRTVYILTSGSKKNVPCTDASGCTAVWPDLPLPDGTSSATAGKGVDASLLGTMKESDGETYPTYNGYLMYEYASDSGPGQANGQGIVSFGGTWYVLNASGQPITSGGSSGGGGGNGY